MAAFKIVVFVPESAADSVRQAAGEAGAGRIGNYTFCSFSSSGIGRFLPGDGAKPTIGTIGQVEKVAEERIEFLCDEGRLEAIVAAIKSVHPYEEVALDIYPIYSPHE